MYKLRKCQKTLKVEISIFDNWKNWIIPILKMTKNDTKKIDIVNNVNNFNMPFGGQIEISNSDFTEKQM